MIADRLSAVRARLAAAAAAAGRDPGAIRLVAVSKTHPPEAIEAAYAAGQRDFGESYAQELRDKARALAHLPDLRWHFIGRIQTNKARYIGPVAARVHALTSVDHARALAARSPNGLDALVHVNVDGEASKAGVAPSEALALCDALDRIPDVRVRGLMALPPFTDDPADAASTFAAVAALAAQGIAHGLDLQELSMGMSRDLEVAIAHGATWVRVGTAIFGHRGPPTDG